MIDRMFWGVIERLVEFLPSFITLFLIILASLGCFEVFYRYLRRRGPDLLLKIGSIEWQKSHPFKVSLLTEIPTRTFFWPVFEEWLFRAPIVIAFMSISVWTWIGILASASLFAARHWLNRNIFFEDILKARRLGIIQSDDVANARKELLRSGLLESEITRRKKIQVAATFLLGIITGYCGIRYQSIWLAVGIHAAWNSIPFVFLMLVLVKRSIVRYMKERRLDKILRA